MKKLIYTLFLSLFILSAFMAGGCRVKPSTSPEVTSSASTPTFTATPLTPTATPTPVTIPTITSSNFNSVVLSSKIPVMVYCTASWCPVCTWMDPYTQLFADENVGKVLVVKVDCSSGTPSFVNGYGVPGYPTSLFFKGGKFITEIAGGVDNVWLDSILASL